MTYTMFDKYLSNVKLCWQKTLYFTIIRKPKTLYFTIIRRPNSLFYDLKVAMP